MARAGRQAVLLAAPSRPQPAGPPVQILLIWVTASCPLILFPTSLVRNPGSLKGQTHWLHLLSAAASSEALKRAATRCS